MFDAVITVLLRGVRDESRVDVPTHEAGKKEIAASEAIESASKRELNADNLGAAARQAILPAPSMWN